ncbi:MAG: NAD-dependent succinate-semialdehyde dehydrogenase [Alphaproteobacteria bacterium]|nr:NAD-dependent succinate-semialdehyde dehydrogenase [Alphaproteobacteria bacterium]
MLNLKDKSLLETRAYINGEWLQSDKKFAVYSPINSELIANVADMLVVDCKAAIDAAYVAQKAWSKQPAKSRAQMLNKLFRLMMENQDDLAAIITAEMGKPLAESKGEIAYGASYIEWFAEEAKRIYGDTIPAPSADKRILVTKQAVGVVGSITPWNFPSAMMTRKLAPALAAGCSFVARPAELTPLSALAVAVLAERAGIPAGVFNVIPSSDAASIGAELCSNAKISKITFTGSTRVGKILMHQCADGIKKMSMELGGNAPFIVFDDADLDAAVEGAIIAKYRNSGQTCVCANRIYVQSAVYKQFADKLAIAVNELKVGNGFVDKVTVGPLISEAALEKVEAHLADAQAKGAKVKTGGKRHSLGGTYFEPTILTGVTASMQVASEETFGPLAPLFEFETEDQVIELANDTEFGLAGYFYSQDMGRVFRVSEALEVGMVGVNTGLISNEAAPFGGIKQSGMGREGSKYGIEDYLEIKYICIGGI